MFSTLKFLSEPHAARNGLTALNATKILKIMNLNKAMKWSWFVKSAGRSSEKKCVTSLMNAMNIANSKYNL